MEKRKIELGEPVIIEQVKLIPVMRFWLNEQSRGGRFFCFGTKQPVYIIAVTPSEKMVFNTDGEEIPLDKLMIEVPDIEEKLVQIKKESSTVTDLPDSGG